MEKKNKIIIAVLVIIIVALIAAVGFMFFGGMNPAKSSNANATVYNFDSAFTMEVPKGTVFKKSWNNSGDGFGVMKTYDDKNKKFSVGYMESFMITDDFINLFIEYGNETNNTKVTHQGDLVILENTGNVSQKNPGGNNYKYGIFARNGHQLVILGGNNADKLVEMAKSIEFKG